MTDAVAFLSVILLVVAVVLGGGYLADRYACSTKADDMGYEYRYSMFAGCRIKTEQGWIPMENYRQEERR